MPILDKTYNESTVITTLPTLTRKDGDWAPSEFLKDITTLPIYVGAVNNVNMYIPSNTYGTTPPFSVDNPEANPILEKLFGIHIYDKKFGFDNLKIILPSFGNPYIGSDDDKKGKTYDYNGILYGNVLNGIKDCVETFIGNRAITTYTDEATDIITNTKTKRIIYTPETEAEELTYGPYNDIVTTYFYVNTLKSSDGTYTTGYVPSTTCNFYKEVSSGQYSTYVKIQPYEVDGESYTFGVTMDDNNRPRPAYLRVCNPGTIKKDGRGAIYYKEVEVGTNTYIETNPLTYQYVEIKDGDYNITASDGYGEDAICEFDIYDSIPGYNVLVSYKNDNTIDKITLVLDNEQSKNYSSIKVFDDNGYNDITIDCKEQVWGDVNTTKVTEKSNKKIFVRELIGNMVVDLTNFVVEITKTTYTPNQQISVNIVCVEYTFNIPSFVHDKIGRAGVYCASMGKTSEPGKKDSFYKTIIGSSIQFQSSSSFEYYESTRSDGSIKMTCYETGVYQSKHYIGRNYSTIGSIIDKHYYRFNNKTNNIQTLEYKNNKKVVTMPGSDNPEYFCNIELMCGATVNCIIDRNGQFIDGSNGTVTLDGVEYTYRLSNPIISQNNNRTEYPLNTKTSIFKLLGTLGSGNEKRGSNGEYEITQGVNAFIICTKTQIGNTKPQIEYLSYSPKICLKIPEIYAIDNNTIFIQVPKDDGNEYLLNFEFSIDMLVPEETGEDTVLVPIENKQITPDSWVVENQGYKVVLDSELSTAVINHVTVFKNVFIITDVTGMQIKYLRITKQLNSTE